MSDIIPDVLGSDESEDVLRLYKDIQDERKRFLMNKLVLDALHSCELEKKLRKKLDRRLAVQQLKNCADLGDSTITNLVVNELSTEEKKTVLSSVCKKIREMKEEILKTKEHFSKDISLRDLSTNEQLENELLKALYDQQQKYALNLHKMLNLTKKMFEERREIIQDLCTKQTEEYKHEEKLLDTRMDLLEVIIKHCIFKETPATLPAFKIAQKDIEDKQKECKHKITELLALKKKYQEVKCTEFDEILKQYIRYAKMLKTMEDLSDAKNLNK